MTHLWIIYCRSVLEQSAEVWSSSLSEENKKDMDRTQKSFVKLVLQKQYKTENDESYENALLKLILQNLDERRRELCLKFAKDCIKNEKLIDLFPQNVNNFIDTRYHEEYSVLHSNTERLKKSSVVYMQNLLNTEEKRAKLEIGSSLK